MKFKNKMAATTLVALLLAILPIAAADPEPLDESLLFEGPAPGKIIYKPISTWTTADCTILFITKDAAFVRIKDTVRVISTKSYEIERVEGVYHGKPVYWTVDAQKQLTGTTIAFLKPEMPKSTFQETDLSKYFYFLAARLQECVDQAIARKDTRAIKQIRSRIEDLIEYARAKNVQPGILNLLTGFDKYIDSQLELEKERQKYLDDHLEKIELNRILDEEAKLRSEIEKTKGLGQYYRGAFPRVTVRLRPNGQAAGATASYDLGGAMAGVATMMRANLQYEHDRLRIVHAKRLLTKDKEKHLDSLAEKVEQAKLERFKAIAAVGERSFGQPRVKDAVAAKDQIDLLYRRGDFGELSKLLATWSELEQGSLEFQNPFSIMEGFHVRSRYDTGKREDQARATFESSKAAVRLVRFIPPDKIFDADRADVLRSAAALGLSAAIQESPEGSIGTAYSPSATYAVRCLDRASEFQGIDSDGTLREQKALANAACGRYSEAFRLINEVKEMRKGVIDFLVTYARIATVHEKTKEAFDAIQDAVDLGYNDILFLTKNPDFFGLRRDKTRYGAYMKPQLSVTWVRPTTAKLPKGDTSNRFEIKNDSPYALTDMRVSLKVEFRGKGDQPLQKAVTIRELPKGQKYEWDSVFDGTPASVYRLKVVIETDQGKYETERVPIK